MKFIIDVGVGIKVEKYLQKTGYDIKSIRNINARLSDVKILELAVSEKRMIITMDKDFGELVYSAGKGHFGILLLRLEGATGEEKTKVVTKVLEEYGTLLKNKLRIKK